MIPMNESVTIDENTPLNIMETYRNDEYGFSFRYPGDWQEVPLSLLKTSSPTVIVCGIFGEQPDNASPPSIIVSHGQSLLSKKPDEDGYFHEVRALMPRMLQGMQAISQTVREFEYLGFREIGDKTGLYCRYIDGELPPVETHHLAFLHKDKQFVVTICDSQASFDKNRPLFDSLFDSFRFD